MNPRRRRKSAVFAAAALVGSGFAVFVPNQIALAGTQTVVNTCDDSVTPGTYTDLPLTVTGEGTPDPAIVGTDTITLGSGLLDTTVPSDLFLAGYRAFVLNVGVNTADATVDLTIEGSNTTEGSQLVSGTVTGLTFTITDPTPANRASGDEAATPLAVSVPLPNSTWTPTSEPSVVFRQTAADIFATVTSGAVPIPANFFCLPGTTDPADDTIRTLNPNPTPFETVVTTAPPSPPVANDDGPGVGPWGNAVVGGGESVVVNVLANDTDVNGDIDPASVNVTVPPLGGTTSVNTTTGAITYTNTDINLTQDTFTYEVGDVGLNGTDTAVVTIDVLGNLCTADPSCDLNQVISVPVVGAVMTLEQAAPEVLLPGVANQATGGCDPGPVVLNGQPQGACGALNQMTVVNARGTDAGWSLTGQTTDFSDGTGVSVCPATDPSTWDNHCIPGDNLGWFPSAAVAHTVIPGDVATVNAGTLILPPAVPGTGLGSSAQELCSAPVKQAGGTFTCDAGLVLAVPASAAAGTYVGTLTLTLA